MCYSPNVVFANPIHLNIAFLMMVSRFTQVVKNCFRFMSVSQWIFHTISRSLLIYLFQNTLKGSSGDFDSATEYVLRTAAQPCDRTCKLCGKSHTKQNKITTTPIYHRIQCFIYQYNQPFLLCLTSTREKVLCLHHSQIQLLNDRGDPQTGRDEIQGVIKPSFEVSVKS